MNESVMEGHSAGRSSLCRRMWLCAGTVLWVLVVIASVMLLRAERADRLAAEQHRRELMAAASAPAAAPARTISLDRYSSDDGAIKLKVSDLLAEQPAPSENVSAWDPEGIADFSFTNCDGRTIMKADLLGRPWVVCFVFTHCLGPCPAVTRQMKELQDRLKHYDVRLVTLSVDPARDTPDVLLHYAKQNGADLKRWYFLTGDETEMYRLVQQGFLMPMQQLPGSDRQVLHTTNVLLVDARGVVRSKFNAAKDDEMAALRRELQEMAERLPTSAEQDGMPPVADAAR